MECTMTRRDETRRDETRSGNCDRIAFSRFLPLMLVVCGSCSVPVERDIALTPKTDGPPASRSKPPDTWFDPVATRHDSGLVLAGSDVTQSHTYRVANTSSHPVRIRGVSNRKPCCGDVAPIAPMVLPPGQSVEVVVTVKIGLGSGDVQHLAVIETEGDADPSVDLITTATAHARVIVDEVGSISEPLEPGQSRRVEYLVRSFGNAGHPPPPLDGQAIRCGLKAEWVGSATKRADAETGLDEVRRTLAVTLPAASEPGPRSMLLEILGGGGAVVGQQWIGWEVASALMANPSGLIFSNSTPTAGLKVIVRCRDGRLFRILSAKTEVAGLIVQGDGDDARPTHQINARLDHSGTAGIHSGEIVVRTDHPDQSVIKVAVYLAGTKVEAAPEASR